MSVLLKLAWLMSAVALSASSVLQTPTKDGAFELLILHNNDMHARFEQTSQLSGVCTAAERDAGKCYGGFPRVATVVKEARRAAASGEGPPVLYLNAGDTYTGTAWFTLYKWKIAAEFINAIQPDAVSLGNNEFAKGEKDLSPFLKSLRTPILSSNVIPNTDKQNIQKSIVFDINGIKVGVVGYLGLDTAILDNSNNIEYIDEVLAVREEVSNLQKNKVNIIIALGHSDPSKDVEIAKEVEGIDLVIGGHKNEYFWNGTSAETVSPISDKVVSVTNNSGKKVPIFHSFAYNEYLGKLKIVFDNQGEIIEYNLNPVLLDNSIPQDTESIQIIQNYKDIISKDASEIIGNTSVVLDGDSCRLEECNLGNLITDAIVHYHATLFEGDQPWTDAPIAIIHGGAIAGSIAPSNRPAPLTRGDLLAALPSEGGIIAVTVSGTRLIQLLEHSAAVSGTSDGYLQFSGIRVVYNFQNEIGSRVVTALARCGSCYVPEFYIIEDNRSYKVLMPASLLNERYGYNMLSDLPQEKLPYDEVTCVAEYIRTRSPIYPEVAGRITQDGRDSAAPLNSSITVLCLIVLAFITN